MIDYDEENFLTFYKTDGQNVLQLPTLQQWAAFTEISYLVCDISFSGTVTNPYRFRI